MIRSSGTLCSLSTSTALIAEPPVADSPVRGQCPSSLQPPAPTSAFPAPCTHRASGRGGAHIAVRCLAGASPHVSPARRRKRGTHLGVEQLRLRGLLVLARIHRVSLMSGARRRWAGGRTRWMRILPIRTLLQTSRRPASIAYPHRKPSPLPKPKSSAPRLRAESTRHISCLQSLRPRI